MSRLRGGISERYRARESELAITQSPRLSTDGPDHFRSRFLRRFYPRRVGHGFLRRRGIKTPGYDIRVDCLVAFAPPSLRRTAGEIGESDLIPIMSSRLSTATLAWTLVVVLTMMSPSTDVDAWPTFRRRDVFDNVVDGPDGLIAHLRNFGGSLYGFPSNETGLRVARWHKGMDVNPEELGEYAEGDILFPPITGRSGLAAVSARWPNGIIPFVISPYFSE